LIQKKILRFFNGFSRVNEMKERKVMLVDSITSLYYQGKEYDRYKSIKQFVFVYV